MAAAELGGNVTVDPDTRTVTLPQRIPDLPPLIRMRHHKALQDLAAALGVRGTRHDPQTGAPVPGPMALVDLVQGYPAMLVPAYAWMRVRDHLGAQAPTVAQFLDTWDILETGAAETPGPDADPTRPPHSGSSP